MKLNALALCLALTPIIATSPAAAHSHVRDGQRDVKEVLGLVEAFLEAAPINDAEVINGVTAESFRVVVVQPNSEVVRLIEKATYISLIEGGKLGSYDRSYTIESADIFAHQLASIRVRIDQPEPTQTFHAYFAAARVGGRWKLVQYLVNQVTEK